MRFVFFQYVHSLFSSSRCGYFIDCNFCWSHALLMGYQLRQLDEQLGGVKVNKVLIHGRYLLLLNFIELV